jgi:hypothetical protein
VGDTVGRVQRKAHIWQNESLVSRSGSDKSVQFLECNIFSKVVFSPRS